MRPIGLFELGLDLLQLTLIQHGIELAAHELEAQVDQVRVQHVGLAVVANRGELAAIRDYCETDVLNTYLIYLRFQLVRGELDPVLYQGELQQVEAKLEQSDRPHLTLYLETWRKTRAG